MSGAGSVHFGVKLEQGEFFVDSPNVDMLSNYFAQRGIPSLGNVLQQIFHRCKHDGGIRDLIHSGSVDQSKAQRQARLPQLFGQSIHEHSEALHSKRGSIARRLFYSLSHTRTSFAGSRRRCRGGCCEALVAPPPASLSSRDVAAAAAAFRQSTAATAA